MRLRQIAENKNETPLYLSNKGNYILNIETQTVYKTMDFESKEWEIEGVNGRVLLDGNYNVLFANDNQIVFVDNEKGEILDVENCTLINVEETTEGNLSQKLLCYKNSQKLNGKRVKDVGYLDLQLDEFKLIKEKIEFNEILPTKRIKKPTLGITL